MIAEFRTKSQITIPKEIVKSLGLAKGDKVENFEKDGDIYIVPVVVYRKKYVDELRIEINEAKAKIASGELSDFGSVDKLFASLEEKRWHIYHLNPLVETNAGIIL